jgi:hypothetical protein
MSNQLNRILAVEIRAARMGYAVFEPPRQLQDFGAVSFSAPSLARKRIARLLSLHCPSMLVLHGSGSRYPKDMRVRKTIARIVHSEAETVAVSTSHISENTFKSFFEQYSCRNKYDIATVLAKWFPELAWRIPQAIDFYDAEPAQMIYFDSIALGVVHLALSETKKPMSEDENRILSPASK